MLSAVVLAAGKGTRMESDLPKVLHPLGYRRLIDHVLSKVLKLVQQTIVVVGYRGDLVKGYVESRYERVEFAWQKDQLGTAHAVLSALHLVKGDRVLIAPGDMPLVSLESLRKVVEETESADGAVLVARLSDPSGYGRVVVEEGRVLRVVEEQEATCEERKINLVNTGVYCFRKELLVKLLPLVKNENSKGEYYLTDVVEIMDRKGYTVAAVETEEHEGMGVNDRRQLSRAYTMMARANAEKLISKGVTVLVPENTFIEDGVEVGRDTVIYPFVFLSGDTRIGEGCTIMPFSVIRDCHIGDGVVVHEHSVLEGAVIEDEVVVGPFARLRSGTHLKRRSKIGNFVEVKKSVIGENSKANHLAYIGDATVGRDVNIGAGTITCNYDGVKKHPTFIGDGAFIGSDTQLVAPVRIGSGALIGAGSTITKDVPPDALALTRAPLRIHEGKGVKYFKKKKYGLEE